MKVRLIEKGGLGRVEELTQTDGTRVARKTFDPDPDVKIDGQKLIQRFRREVKVQEQLGKADPKLFLPVLGHDLDVEPPWFTMPLAEKTLRRVVKRACHKGEFPLDPLLHILDGLEYLHEMEYVHRDVKPENVLLHEGRWKLSDLGLVLDRDDDFRTTTSDALLSTAAYTAPEMARGIRHATPFVDIYAFGCILHDVVTGCEVRTPFVVHTHPGPYGFIIERCTVFDPLKRFPHIGALRETLLETYASTEAHFSAVVSVRETTDVDAWTKADVAGFVRKFENAAEEDATQQLQRLKSNVLDTILALSKEDWERLGVATCEIVSQQTFNWDFCDFLVGVLEHFFDGGSVRIKADAIVAAAVLGKDHHRYHVMKKVLAMAGRNLDEPVARRVVLEIRARELKNVFRGCAKGIGRSLLQYHPLICEALE